MAVALFCTASADLASPAFGVDGGQGANQWRDPAAGSALAVPSLGAAPPVGSNQTIAAPAMPAAPVPEPSLSTLTCQDRRGGKKVVRYPEEPPASAWQYALGYIKACRDCHDFLKNCRNCETSELVASYLALAERYRVLGFLFRHNARPGGAIIENPIRGQHAADDRKVWTDKERKWLASAMENFQAAVGYYVEALEIRDNPRLEEILVGLGDVYLCGLGKPELARAQYERLIAEVPLTKSRAQAYLALGEIHFAQSDWRGAEKLYEKAAASRDVRVASCAAYGKAWTLYRQGYRYLARKELRACRELAGKESGAMDIHDACIVDEQRLSRPR